MLTKYGLVLRWSSEWWWSYYFDLIWWAREFQKLACPSSRFERCFPGDIPAQWARKSYDQLGRGFSQPQKLWSSHSALDQLHSASMPNMFSQDTKTYLWSPSSINKTAPKTFLRPTILGDHLPHWCLSTAYSFILSPVHLASASLGSPAPRSCPIDMLFIQPYMLSASKFWQNHRQIWPLFMVLRSSTIPFRIPLKR